MNEPRGADQHFHANMNDCEEAQFCVEECNTTMPYKERGNSEMGFTNEKHNEADCRPHLFITAPGSATAIAMTVNTTLSPAVPRPTRDIVGPVACMCEPMGSVWDAMESTRPSSSVPVSAAAHLHLLGEALLLIGHLLKGTNRPVCVSRSLLLLLDSLLCALAPLMCLTSLLAELQSCTENTPGSALENIAYIMPGF